MIDGTIEAIGWAWLVELQWMGTVVFTCAEVAARSIRQPARRLVVARHALICSCVVIALATFRAGMAWIESGEAGLARTRVAAHIIHAKDCPCSDPDSIVRSSPFTLRRSILCGFGVGAAFAIAWLGVGWALAGRLARRGVAAAPERLEKIWLRVAGPFATRIALGVSASVDAPAILGPRRPIILVPTEFAGDKPDRVIEAALRHEVAHARRGDLWTLVILRALFPFFYLNPLFFHLKMRIRDDQETLADDDVVEVFGVLAYAEAMIDWAKMVQARRRSHVRLGLTLNAWSRPSSLDRRLALILDPARRVELECPAYWRPLASLTAVGLIASMAAIPRPIAEKTPGTKQVSGGSELPLECRPSVVLCSEVSELTRRNESAFQCSVPQQRWQSLCLPESR